MKILILAAGYGTRLQKDIESNSNYSHLYGLAKPLLPLGKQPLIQYWVDFFVKFKHVEDIYVITNSHYHQDFLKWADQYSFPKEHIVDDKSLSVSDQKGSMGDVDLFISTLKLNEKLVIVGGDTLFPERDMFNIQQSILDFEKDESSQARVLYYENRDVDTKKVGILEINSFNYVTGFLEKPDPSQTTSRICCPCFYMLDKDAVSQVSKFIKETGKNDATGFFIQYLIKNHKVFGHRIDKRYDVGNLKDYILTNDDYEK